MEIIRKIYLFLLDTVQTFLIAAAVFLVIYVFLFRPFEVKGESMLPNFYDKEYVLTNLIILRFQTPKLGDVIVFKAPPEPDKDYIKRIIGTPGDTVSIKEGKVYLNDKMLNENEYLKPDVKTFAGEFLSEGQTVKVPQDEYFVLGDNRQASSDSRKWGEVARKNIIGRAWLRAWPFVRLGAVNK